MEVYVCLERGGVVGKYLRVLDRQMDRRSKGLKNSTVLSPEGRTHLI